MFPHFVVFEWVDFAKSQDIDGTVKNTGCTLSSANLTTGTLSAIISPAFHLKASLLNPWSIFIVGFWTQGFFLRFILQSPLSLAHRILQ